MAEILVFEDIVYLQKSVVEKIIALSAKHIEEQDRFTIALSGGSTPSGLYAMLATNEYAKKINWKKVFVFWGDERMVAMDNADNNGYNAQQFLLNKVQIPAENIFRVNTTLSPTDAAADYQKKIEIFFNNPLPSFDLLLLGMGTNGHTASLFPHTDILHETKALVKEVYLKDQNSFRISFTVPLINNAKNIFFIVTGKEKALMLNTVIHGEYSPSHYPAQYIRTESNNLYWFVDSAAATNLKK